MIYHARPRYKYNQIAHAIWLSFVLGTPAMAQAPERQAQDTSVFEPSKRDAENPVQELTLGQVQEISGQLNRNAELQQEETSNSDASISVDRAEDSVSELSMQDGSIREQQSFASENAQLADKQSTNSDDVIIDTDVPWIWTDLCIEQTGDCYTNVASRRRDGKWEVDLSEENMRVYNIDSSSLNMKKEGDENWVVLDDTTYDAGLLKITWSLPLSNMEGQILNSPGMPQYTNVEPGRHPFSVSLDYNLAYGGKFSGAGRLAVGKGNTALLTSGSISQGGDFIQGLTWLEHDQPEKNLRWSAGDIVASSFDALGAGLLIEGVSVRKVFDTTPTKIFTARPSMTGVIDRAGTLEVYSNGVLISSQEVRPGPFTLQQLGVGYGRQDISIVLRDVAGNRSVVNQTSYYGSSGLLEKGVNDYGLSVGKIKPSAILDGPVLPAERIVQAYYRRGLNNRITTGARVDWGQSIQSYGLNTVFTSPIGQFDLSAATSSVGGEAYSGSYMFTSSKFSFFLRHEKRDDNYRVPGDLNFAPVSGHWLDRILETSQASISTGIIPGVSLSLLGAQERYVSGRVEKNAGVMLSGNVKKVQWNVNFQQRKRNGEPRENIAGLSFSVPFGSVQNASFSAQKDADGGVGYATSFTKSRQDEFGFSYAANAQQNAMGIRSMTLRGDYQGKYGLYGIQLDQFGPARSVLGNMSGGVVFTDKNLFFTPPLSGSFAVLSAPNAPGVPIMRENLPVGTTNSKGYALIRNLGAYYPSQIGFDPEALPIDMSPGLVLSKRIVPTPHTATIIEFNAAPVVAVQAHLVWPDGAPVKYGAVVFSDPINQTVSVGSNGMLWLENVAAGTYTGDLSTDVGMGRCTLTIEKKSKGVQDLGEVVCERLTSRIYPKSSEEQSKEPQASSGEQPPATGEVDPQMQEQEAQEAQEAGQGKLSQGIMPTLPTKERNND